MREIIRTGGWPHLSGLTPTWGPHLHAKRPEEGIVFRPKDSSNSMGPVARRNFTLDVTGQPCCLVHSSSWVRPHTGRKLHGFLNQMQKFGHTQKAKFRVFAVYKWLSSLDFYFSLSLLPSFFAFLASFFSLAAPLIKKPKSRLLPIFFTWFYIE